MVSAARFQPTLPPSISLSFSFPIVSSFNQRTPLSVGLRVHPSRPAIRVPFAELSCHAVSFSRHGSTRASAYEPHTLARSLSCSRAPFATPSFPPSYPSFSIRLSLSFLLAARSAEPFSAQENRTVRTTPELATILYNPYLGTGVATVCGPSHPLVSMVF